MKVILFIALSVICICVSADDLLNLNSSIDKLNITTSKYLEVNNLILDEISRTGTVSPTKAKYFLKKLEKINPRLFLKNKKNVVESSIARNSKKLNQTLTPFLAKQNDSTLNHKIIDQNTKSLEINNVNVYNQLSKSIRSGKSYALVIGIGRYNDKLFQSLPSEKDAVKIKNFLINEANFDVVHLLLGEQATFEKIRYLMLDYYPKVIEPNDRFLLYWSGNGTTSDYEGKKSGYLVLKKSVKHQFSSMQSMGSLLSWGTGIKAKQMLYLLDTCLSDSNLSLRAISISGEQNEPSKQVLKACKENQQSLAINDFDGGGLFTRTLLDGLQGHADTFKKDGVVTIRELEKYVRERVNHERFRLGWDEPITPQLYSLSGSQSGVFFFGPNKNLGVKLKIEN